MPKYGASAQKSVERAMHKKKAGTLKSGRSKGAKVPRKASGTGKSSSR